MYSAHNGRGVGLPYCRPFLSKFNYFNFGRLAITGVAGHLSNFSQNVRDGEQNLLWVLNRNMVPTMVGEWVYHIAVLFWQNHLILWD